MEETKRCPFCAEEIQAAAIRCKHCHADLAAAPAAAPAAPAAPQQPAVRPVFAVLLVLLIIGFGVAGVSSLFNTPTSHPDSEATKKDDVQITAWVMAQGFVKKHLKSPGSADFGSVFKGDYQSATDHVRSLGGNRFKASGWVDSQNDFGALVRTNFSVTMERDSTGTWTAVEGPTLDSR